jgi:ABC-2 type transport system permease protein
MFAGVKALAALEYRQMLCGGRWLMFVIIYALPALVLLLVGNLIMRVDLTLAFGVGHNLSHMIILPLSSLMVSGTVFGREITHKTITYIFTRPIPRPVILLTFYLIQEFILILFFSVSLVFFGMVLSSWRPLEGVLKIISQLWIGGVLAILSYGAIFLVLGLFTRRALVVGFLYLVILEWTVSNVPAVVQKASVMYYIRSVMYPGITQMEEVFMRGFFVFQPVGEVTGLGVLGGIVVLALILGSIVISLREFAIREEI